MDPTHTLVITYGNSLRGDDGLGVAAAAIIQSWQTPGVGVLVTHQLVPELIEEMKQVDRVFFIDAAIDTEGAPFRACVVEPAQPQRFFGHHEHPARLLALLRDLEGRAPRAWLVSIAARSFDHGATLTEPAQENLRAALAWFHAFLAEHACTKSA